MEVVACKSATMKCEIRLKYLSHDGTCQLTPAESENLSQNAYNTYVSSSGLSWAVIMLMSPPGQLEGFCVFKPQIWY